MAVPELPGSEEGTRCAACGEVRPRDASRCASCGRDEGPPPATLTTVTTLEPAADEATARDSAEAFLEEAFSRSDAGETDHAFALAERALSIARGIGDRPLEGRALTNLGLLAHLAGSLEGAESTYLEAVTLYRRTGDARRRASVLARLGSLRLDRGALPEARATLDEARDVAVAAGDPAAEARVLTGLARMERLSGEGESAAARSVEAEARARQSGDPGSIALVLCERGHLAIAKERSAEGELEEALSWVRAEGAAPRPELDRATLKLRCAQDAFEERMMDRCHQGELLEGIPRGLLRWLHRTGRLAGPVAPEGDDEDTPPESIGPYRIVEVLGRGGGGIVYRCQDPAGGQELAVKTVALRDRHRLTHLRREVHALARLRHPGVVRIVGSSTDTERPWYAMELLPGLPLDRYCRAHWDPQESATRSPSAIPEGALRTFVEIAGRLCGTLAYLHGEGIVHRDLKPGNVLVDAEGWPRIVDFGLASRSSGRTSREQLDEAFVHGGSALYIAPEQVLMQIVDARADLYALGVILYEMLAGRPPFVGKTTAEILDQHLHAAPEPLAARVAGVPPELAALVMRLLAKDPRNRIGYAVDVAEALARLRLGEVPTPDRTRSYLYQPRLAGRDAALHQLLPCLAALRQGRGGIVWVGGESGLGKTRLAMEAVRTAMSEGAAVLTGECTEGSGIPFEGMRGVLQGIGDRCREGGVEATERLLGDRARSLASYEPSLGRLPGVAALPAAEELPERAARVRLNVQVGEVLAALARESPCLVLVDDMQWADELTLGFLAHLLRGDLLERTPLLLIATYRSEEAPAALLPLVQSPRSTWLRLEPLGDGAVAAMISDMLALDRPPELLSRSLAELSAGNPFFVAEYLRAAVEEGLLWRDAQGQWRAAGEGDDAASAPLALPAALRDVLARRLDGLPAAARAVAEAVAAIGHAGSSGAPLQLVAEVGDLPDETLYDGLGDLFSRQVLAEGAGTSVVFTHLQIQEVAYAAIATERRAELHGRAAQRLASLPEAERATRLPELGRHWQLAGDPLAAARAFLGAARFASRRYARAEAERLYRACLEIAHPGGAEDLAARRELVHEALMPRGKSAEARREIDRLMHDARAAGDRRTEGEAHGSLGLLYWRTGNVNAALASFTEALGIFRAVGGARRSEGVSLVNQALCHSEQGRSGDARRCHDEAVAIAREIGDARLEGGVLGNAAEMLQKEGRFGEARALLEKAIAVHRRAGHRTGVGIALTNVAGIHFVEGRIEEAQALYEEALSIHREVGDRRLEATTIANLADVRRRQGRLEDSQELFERALVMNREIGDRKLEGWTLACLGDLERLATGDLEKGAALLESAMAIATETGDTWEVVSHACAQGHNLLAAGRNARALIASVEAMIAALDAGPGSEAALALAKLVRTETAFERGSALVCGELASEMPAAVLGWLREHRPGSLAGHQD